VRARRKKFGATVQKNAHLLRQIQDLAGFVDQPEAMLMTPKDISMRHSSLECRTAGSEKRKARCVSR
jgi:hypothetical protein